MVFKRKSISQTLLSFLDQYLQQNYPENLMSHFQQSNSINKNVQISNMHNKLLYYQSINHDNSQKPLLFAIPSINSLTVIFSFISLIMQKKI